MVDHVCKMEAKIATNETHIEAIHGKLDYIKNDVQYVRERFDDFSLSMVLKIAGFSSFVGGLIGVLAYLIANKGKML